jgi:hypothetical protein
LQLSPHGAGQIRELDQHQMQVVQHLPPRHQAVIDRLHLWMDEVFAASANIPATANNVTAVLVVAVLAGGTVLAAVLVARSLSLPTSTPRSAGVGTYRR